MQLRDYQTEAVQSVYRFFEEKRGSGCLIVAPTGAGKSVILAEIIRRAITDYSGTRIICATHVKELIQQNWQTLVRLWPDAPAGVFSAGLGKRQTNQPVTFAGIQSVARRAREFGHVNLLIVDEAHLLPRATGTRYQTFIKGLRDINPKLKVIGLTATPFRLDSGRLDSGKDAIFDGIAYDIPVRMLVERGYLAPLISKRPSQVFETKGLHTRMGDFITSEMDEKFGTQAITEQAVAEIVELGKDRNSWLLFCISVKHAEITRAALEKHGIAAGLITGDTPALERETIVTRFKSGELRAMVNVNVLTVGFDAPATDLLAFLRPTQSLGLYLQMAGRAMRTAPGKKNGLVLDYAGNVMRHGPVDAVNVTDAKKDKKKGKAPVKYCPSCDEILHISVRECPECGHSFPPPEPKIERKSGTEAIMNMTAEKKWCTVRDFDVVKHFPRGGGRPSLRADFLVDGYRARISHWACFDHSGFARQKAVEWWQKHAGARVPLSVNEALARKHEIRKPLAVTIEREGKYYRITGTQFERENA